MEEKTLTLTEVADYIGVARTTLYTWIADGRFPVAPIEGTDPRRWNIEDVDNWRFGGKDGNDRA
jgi:excisionase family DNA binding protein